MNAGLYDKLDTVYVSGDASHLEFSDERFGQKAVVTVQSAAYADIQTLNNGDLLNALVRAVLEYKKSGGQPLVHDGNGSGNYIMLHIRKSTSGHLNVAFHDEAVRLIAVELDVSSEKAPEHAILYNYECRRKPLNDGYNIHLPKIRESNDDHKRRTEDLAANLVKLFGDDIEFEGGAVSAGRITLNVKKGSRAEQVLDHEVEKTAERSRFEV